MRQWKVVMVAVLASLMLAGGVQMVDAAGDLFEVGAVASEAEGSARTWAYRTFLVLTLVVAIAAIVAKHVGVFMAAMGLLFLGAFLARGPDAISDAVGLAEGATLESVSRVSAPPPVTESWSPRLVDLSIPKEW
jgi:hypothetical protein